MAWRDGGSISLGIGIVGIVMLIFLELTLTLSDDYYDNLQGNNVYKGGNIHIFTAGTGAISSGALSLKSVWWAQLVGYTIYFSLGVVLAYYIGIYVLIFVVWGFFWAFFHSAPPFRLSYHGLAEIGMLFNLGFVLAEMVYYSFTGTWSWELFWISAPLGMIQFAMMLMQNITDWEEDKNANKIHLAMRLGKRNSLYLHIMALFAGYGFIIVAVAFRLAPIGVLLTFLALPLVISSTRFFIKHHDNPGKMEEALSDFKLFKVHNFFGITLILNYIFWGYLKRQDAFTSLILTAGLFIVWLPVGILLLKLHLHRTAQTSKSIL